MNDEIIFSNVVTEQLEKFKKNKYSLDELKEKIHNMLTKQNNDELLIKIDIALIAKLEKIISDSNNIKTWWESYNNEMSLLNNGFTNKNIELTDNIYFKEAKEMLENEI